MSNQIYELQKTENGYKLIDTVEREMGIEEIKREILNTKMRQDSIIEQSKRLKSEYDVLSEKILKLEQALKDTSEPTFAGIEE